MAEGSDSLTPHVVGIAKSSRARRWFLRALPLVFAATIVPAFNWVTTRAGVDSVRALNQRADKLDRSVGSPAEDDDSGSLLDRMKALEAERDLRVQHELNRDHELYRRMVSLAAATSERNAYQRAATAADAVRLYEQTCNCWGEVGNPHKPYRCEVEPAKAASSALETRPPGR